MQMNGTSSLQFRLETYISNIRPSRSAHFSLLLESGLIVLHNILAQRSVWNLIMSVSTISQSTWNQFCLKLDLDHRNLTFWIRFAFLKNFSKRCYVIVKRTSVKYKIYKRNNHNNCFFTFFALPDTKVHYCSLFGPNSTRIVGLWNGLRVSLTTR